MLRASKKLFGNAGVGRGMLPLPGASYQRLEGPCDGHSGNWSPPIDNRRYLAVRPATDGQRESIEKFWDVIGDLSTFGRQRRRQRLDISDPA